jgi:signal transduction histidine kinase
MPTFTVDTHVFRELGELLVGRDSTALVELIKNSYDADATEVVVYGVSLDDVESGVIRIADNGIGMDAGAFEDGFLRIAGRTKDIGTRRSVLFKRRYTGAKGIGRLAAHKLARVLEVESLAVKNGGLIKGVVARIDWDRVEKKETLDQLAASDAIAVKDLQPPSGAQTGTTITLRRLRRPWTKTEHGRFLEEVQGFGPPKALLEPLPRSAVPRELLFQKPHIRDAKTDTKFVVNLEGDLAPPEDYWAAAVAAANWVLEIDAYSEPESVRFCVAPTARTIEEVGDTKPRRYRMPHPGGQQGPHFQARILLRTGAMRGEEKVRAWSGRASGIRVYMEGFRVLPYGEPGNDWLGLDRDYAERTSDLLGKEIAKALVPSLPLTSATDRPGLLHVPNKNYFGAVFLTQQGAPSLKLLVNREGFVPDASYDRLLAIVRNGIDLTTRVRAMVTAQQRERDREERRASRARPLEQRQQPEPPSFMEVLTEAERYAKEARRLTAAGEADAATAKLDTALERIQQVTVASDELADQTAMLRVLASVGTQLSSFVHELNGLLGMAESIEGALLNAIENATELGRSTRARLREVAKSIADMRRHLERHASYLIDVVSPDARRRRSRQRLHERFESAVRLVRTAADRRGITVVNNIPEDLKSPPMFPAELTTVFANLLTNAIKAAGDGGRIRASARETPKGSAVRVENTGKEVKLSTSERWFRPFESSTTQIDPLLGQGMGLGLTITRAMLEEYGATIRFVAPGSGFATALEIGFNG